MPRAEARYLWVLMLVLAGNMLIDAIEVSSMLVAAPSIGRTLRLGPPGMQWLISGFALGFGGLLVFGGWVMARLGRRQAYLAALVVFALASVAAGLARDPWLLIGTRVIKGLCAALTAPAGLAVIGTVFPSGHVRDRAISVYTLLGASGFSVGLVLSGLLTEVSWRWAVVFPAPVVLVLFALGLRVFPKDEPTRWRAGAVRRALAYDTLLRSALGAAALNGSYLGLLFVATLQFQAEQGWSPLRTALAFLPASVPLAASALYSGRMVRRFGASRLIALGALAPPIGYALYLRQDPPTSYLGGVLPTLLLVAAGFVLCFTALNTQGVQHVPAADRATASAVYQSAVQVGAVLTLIPVAALLTSIPGARSAVLLITAVGLIGLLAGVAGVIPVRRLST